jgi:hypothetical protein
MRTSNIETGRIILGLTLVTTRCYVLEVHSPEVTLLPYDTFSNMKHVRSQKNPSRNFP